MNVAARLQQTAEPGEILVGEATYRLVRRFGRGRPARALVSEGGPAPRGARTPPSARSLRERRRLDRPMIGRLEEPSSGRSTDGQSWEGAAGSSRSSGPPASGSPGLPRVRLAASRRGARRARPLPAVRGGHHVLAGCGGGEGARRVSRRRFGRSAGDRLSGLLGGEDDGGAHRHRCRGCGGAGSRRGGEGGGFVGFPSAARGSCLGNGPSSSSSTTSSGARRRSWTCSRKHVVERSRDARVLVVCLTRPELLDLRPGWGDGAEERGLGAARAASRRGVRDPRPEASR